MQPCAPAMRTMTRPHSSPQSVPAKAIPATCLPAAQSERVGQANTVYPDTKMIIFVGAPTIVSLAAQSAMVPIFMTTADTRMSQPLSLHPIRSMQLIELLTSTTPRHLHQHLSFPQ